MLNLNNGWVFCTLMRALRLNLSYMQTLFRCLLFMCEENKEVLDNRPGSKTQTTEGMKSGREGGGE